MQLTKDFNLSEFNSKDGAKMPANVLKNIKKVAENLQILRDYLGIPIRINSAYRSPSHNEKIGGIKDSQHVQGLAVDIVTKAHTPKQLAKIIEKLIKEKKIIEGGLGVYPSFVHYDIRGVKARW